MLLTRKRQRQKEKNTFLSHLYDCLQCFDAVVGQQEGHPACKKTEWWSAGVAVCLEQDANLHMSQLMPLLLTVSCFTKIHTGFTFLVPANLDSPGKRAVKRVCVCVCLGLYGGYHSWTSGCLPSGRVQPLLLGWYSCPIPLRPEG